MREERLNYCVRDEKKTRRRECHIILREGESPGLFFSSQTLFFSGLKFRGKMQFRERRNLTICCKAHKKQHF